MKLPTPFTIHGSQFTIWKKSSESAVAGRADAAGSRQSPISNRKSERGIALVITLILLSVTLFMAIAFLAISRRERGSVTTATDTATARLAADSALANAQAQIIANIFATTNPYNSSLLVSTNYINVNGFLTGIANATNVSYNYPNGNPLSPVANIGDYEQNIANLFLSPRPPVFITTNQQSGGTDFRFYLDLNRNGNFEDSGGNVPNVDNFGNTNGVISEIGDPQWVGVLERPDVPHGPNNKFLSRYAFVCLPASGSLDLNYIHNQARNASLSASDGFFRNQGVGSWEINLAAFLTDLNTNEWDTVAAGYKYLEPANPNTGFAFQDAFSLLSYRYFSTPLPFASVLLPNYPLSGPVDIIPLGFAMTNTAVPFYNYSLNISWPGADNTNHFFDLTADLFDANKTDFGVTAGQVAAGNYFTGRLLNAGTNVFGGSTVSTYDRYTFYRLLAQLGTDSEPEQGKMNLNYDNLDFNGNVVVGAETNLFAWTALRFFTNAADRMLRMYTTNWFQANPSNYLATYYNIHTNFNDPNGFGLVSLLGVPNVLGLTSDRIPAFGITDIPVLANGQFVYSPAVQRVLQLAANMYDATTNIGGNFPSVFRPTFFRDPVLGNIFITGYEDVSTVEPLAVGTVPLPPPLDFPQDVTLLKSGVTAGLNNPQGNVYGVPWIIGAKKGFPRFNEFSMENAVQITRKLQVTRQDTNSNPPILTATNENFVFSITNSIGVEFWNSYTNFYPDPVQMVVNDFVSMQLTNGFSGSLFSNFQVSPNINIPTWFGSTWASGGGLNTNFSTPFIIPIFTNLTFLTNSVFQWGSGGFLPANIAGWQTAFKVPFVLPQFGLLTTNRLQAFLLDKTSGRIIDYVQFGGPVSQRNLNSEIQTSLKNSSFQNMWDTNLDTGLTSWGIVSQFEASEQTIKNDPSFWPLDDTAKKAIDRFAIFFSGATIGSVPYTDPAVIGDPTVQSAGTNLTMQLPYSPTVTAIEYTSWQANDPLVHYVASDLNYSSGSGATLETGTTVYYNSQAVPLLPNIGVLNNRYQPWGKLIDYAGADQNPFNLAYKDPLVTQSDNWDFPANKFPTIGWLGRVHRGTPWQTVYLKGTSLLSAATGIGTWTNWTGDRDLFDATNTTPIKDRLLFDLFTTALDDNAAHGRLSINVAANTNDPVAGLAAWSALFSGVMVLSNNVSDSAFVSSGPGGSKGRPGVSPTTPPLSYTAFPINPAGGSGLNSQLGQLTTNINFMRRIFTNTDGVVGTFEHVGDILAVPQFTEQSPFLNRDAVQITNNIRDEMYEWLPQQTMGLLTVSATPRYVIYSYGQTLKPAPNGITTDGSFFGMVTNYQVVSEIATRAVVRVNTVIVTDTNVTPNTVTTNYSTTVEQFNVLPPD